LKINIFYFEVPGVADPNLPFSITNLNALVIPDFKDKASLMEKLLVALSKVNDKFVMT
jgi:hypothetical protein